MRAADTRVRIPMPSVRKKTTGQTARRLRAGLCVTLALGTVFALAPLSARAEDTGKINAVNVNMRSGAGTSSDVLKVLAYQADLEILSSSGDWYQVKYNGTVGYVYKDYITITTDVSAPNANISLRNGSTGISVKALQEKLIALGYLKGSADGEYGSVTEAAVRLYQSRKGLATDGVAGKKTLTTLYADNTPYTETFTKLYVGATGSDVRTLQQKLIALEYLSGSADGVYGTKTVAAVKLYQRTNDLEVDGIAGPVTQKALFADNAAYTPTETASGTLKNGSVGESVKTLQSALIYLGYLKGSADGKFGDMTEAAVRLYQRTNGLTVDGLAGPATQGKIYAEKQLCENIVSTVKAQLGIPYVYGGSSTSGFDCSGLTMYVYGKYGIKMGHSTGIQDKLGVAVSIDDIRPGDLVGFYNPCGHVGIYIGGGKFIHAPQTGDVVKITELSSRSVTVIRRFTGAVPND